MQPYILWKLCTKSVHIMERNWNLSNLWSSRLQSSWLRRRRSQSRCWRCRGWSTAQDKCSSGSHSWSPPSLGCSDTHHDDRLHDRSTSDPHSPLRTQSHVSSLLPQTESQTKLIIKCTETNQKHLFCSKRRLVNHSWKCGCLVVADRNSPLVFN